MSASYPLAPMESTALASPLRVLAGGLSAAAERALDVSDREVLARWLTSKAPSTQRAYGSALIAFGAFVTGRDDGDHDTAYRLLVSCTAGQASRIVEGWRDSLVARGLSSGTINRNVSALSALAKLAHRLGVTSWCLGGLAVRPEPRHDRSGPPGHELVRMLDELDEQAESGDVIAARDAAIVGLLFRVGLRRAEVVGLELEHVQLDDAHGPAVHPRRKGKRGRERVGVGQVTAAAVARWLAVHPGNQPRFPPGPGGNQANIPLFVRLDRAGTKAALGALSGESVRLMLRRRAAEAGIRHPVRPHGCRHSGASSLADAGASIGVLMSWGGWSSMSSASRYQDRRSVRQAAGVAVLEGLA